MNFILETLRTVGPFFLLLGLLIFIHELGHFSVARFFGVRVEIFSIGFGKKILVFKRGDTEYRISIFPLGGYVKMFGDNPTAKVAPEEQKYSFIHQSVGARIAIVLAGPLMNLVLALFVFFCIGLYGEPQVSPVIGDLDATTSAFQAGLRPGDKILAVNNNTVRSFDEAIKFISEGSNPATFKISRNNSDLEIQVPTVVKPNPNILSSNREIPQVEGLSMMSETATIAIPDKNSALYQAGLRNLDEIKKINSTPIETYRDLKNYIQTSTAETHKITVSRAENNDKDKTYDFNYVGTTFNFEPTDTYIGNAQPGSPASKAGLKRGDKVIAINETPISKWQDLVETVKTLGLDAKELKFKIIRNYEELEIAVTPQIKAMMNEKGQEIKRPLVGIEPALYLHVPDQVYVPAGGLFASMKYSVKQTWKWTVWTVNSIKRVIQGEVSHKNLGGFITIGQVAKESFKVGWSYFFQMMGIISINLFLLNLLPIPVLDGGHLLFYSIEAVRGKPVSPQKMELAFLFGFALLMSLVGLTLFNDIQRVFFSGW